MYSQDEAGNLVETPFAFNTWTEEEAAAQMSGVSTIYRIEDESGTIIESGYQEATDYNEEAWLTVALPSEIKKVKINAINQKLDALTRDMLMNQQNNLKTLAQMNEIRGLIIDFLSS
jgi:hypothetical protein